MPPKKTIEFLFELRNIEDVSELYLCLIALKFEELFLRKATEILRNGIQTDGSMDVLHATIMHFVCYVGWVLFNIISK